MSKSLKVGIIGASAERGWAKISHARARGPGAGWAGARGGGHEHSGFAGVRVAIGLQARGNPAVRRARELLARGAIGRVLSARNVSTTMAFGSVVEGAMAFAETAENGVTLVTIQGAHTIDTAIAVLGGFADASALATTQYGQVEVEGVAGRQARSTPDHVLVQARLAGGAALSLETAGGRPPDTTSYLFEVTGETGMLALHGGAPCGFQSGRLRLLLDGADQALDEGEAAGLPETAANVAGLYAALRDDIRNGTATAPDLEHATRLSRLVEDLMASSQSGARRKATDWPPL